MCDVLNGLGVSLVYPYLKTYTVFIFATLLVALLLVLKYTNCLFSLLLYPLDFFYLGLVPL